MDVVEVVLRSVDPEVAKRLEKLPPAGAEWSRYSRANWLRGLRRTLDRAYKNTPPPERVGQSELIAQVAGLLIELFADGAERELSEVEQYIRSRLGPVNKRTIFAARVPAELFACVHDSRLFIFRRAKAEAPLRPPATDSTVR